MTAVFSKFNCPKSVMNKTSYLTDQETKTLLSYEPIDDLSGYIIVSSDLVGYNYVKMTITGMDRYYYIISREPMTGGRFKIYIEEDVLNTFKDIIGEANCIVDNGYIYGNEYMNIGNLPILGFNRLSETASSEIPYNDGNHNLYFSLLVASNSTTDNTSSANKFRTKTLQSLIGSIFG